MALLLTDLEGLNYAHAKDVLFDDYGITVSRSTVERYAKAVGRKPASPPIKVKTHRRRQPRAHEGSLVQIDASSEFWSASAQCKWHLHGAIDDATGLVLALSFCHEECLYGYAQLILQMNRRFGLPRQIYADGRTVFTYKKKTSSVEDDLFDRDPTITNFTRAARTHHMTVIIANSPQAKGKIERLWRTLHDRLKKDLKRKNIQTIKEANAFLPQFIASYNKRFANPAASPEKFWSAPAPERVLKFDFSFQVTRRLDPSLSFSFQNKHWSLPRYDLDNKKLPVRSNEPLIVAYSELIGVQAKINGQICTPEVIQTSPLRKSTAGADVETRTINQTRRPADDHPWRHSK